MAIAYKTLGQILPTDSNSNDIYQVPAATSAVISTLNIANVTGSSATAQVFLKKTAFDLTQGAVVTPATFTNLLGATYGNGTYVIVGANAGTPTSAYSTNGSTWVSASVTGANVSSNTVSWGNGLFVIGSNSGTLATSPDGITWTSRTSNLSTNNILASVYGTTNLGASLYVVAGAAGALATSPDGTTWTSRTSGFSTTQINGLAYGAGLFVAVGNSGTLTTSMDGVTWTSRTSGFSTTNITSAAYGLGVFVAVGASGTITRSTDGITWTASTSGTTSQINQVIWTGSQFVGVISASSNNVITSPDGITWTLKTNSFFTAASSIAYGNSKYVIPSATGTLVLTGSIPTTRNAVMYSASVAANSMNSFTLGMTLTAGDALVVQSGIGNALTFTIFGSEIS